MNNDSLKKYFDAETTLDEEKSLLQELADAKNHPESPYFTALQKLKAKKKSERRRKQWFIAASVAAVLSIGLLLIPSTPSEIKPTTVETAEAYRETQEALLLLSSKLNQSSERMTPIGQFEKTKNELENKKETK